MTNPHAPTIADRCYHKSVSRILALAALLALFSFAASAQTTTTSSTDIATPGGLAAGSPAGSYQLSGFENINLYNGNLDFHLPLIAVGGRGEAGFSITLSLNTKKWSVKHSQTQTTETWYPTSSSWGMLQPGYSAGVMQGRRTGYRIKNTAGCSGLNKQIYQDTLTTLTFTGPDGTEYGFRDDLHDGQRMAVTEPCPSFPYTGASRGTVWITADGSAATFISDTEILDLVDVPAMNRTMHNIDGYMLLRNGARYRIENGRVVWIRDRNGNMIYNVQDSLGRQFGQTSVGEYPTYEHQFSYKGFGSAARLIRVTHDRLENALRPDYSLQTPANLFPDLPGALLHNSGDYNPVVVTSVILPNGQTYQFRYNSYGELARVVLPTGGAIEYDMTPDSGVVSGNNGQGDDFAIYRRVVERRTYKDGSATPATRTFYEAPALGGSMVEVKHYDGATLVASEKHYFASNVVDGLIQQLDGLGFPIATYPDWFEGKETMVDSYATDGTTATTLLRRTVNGWQPGATLGGFSVNPRIAYTTTTLSDTNQVSKQVFEYDQCTGCNPLFNNQTDVYEYDYGPGAPGVVPVRRTHTDYVTAAVYTDPSWGPHIRSLPSQVSVFEGSIERSRTVFEYDNYADDANHKPLVDRPNIIGLEATFQSTSYLARGNVTATTAYLLNSSGNVTGSVTGYAQYDIAGNVVKVIDARGYATTLSFSDRFGSPDGEARANLGSTELNAAGKYSYAFATSVTNALGHTAYAQFDYYLGQPVDGEDANGIVSSGYFADSLDRPKRILRASNQPVSAQSQTSFDYDDINRVITTTSDQNTLDDNLLKSQVKYDGLGRVVESRQYETATTYIAVEKKYDGVGRASETSNPYRVDGNPVDLVWTITGFDALGRVISVKTPDNAIVSTAYSGNTVTVTDQAGKTRRSITDGLGRLVRVDEPNDAGTLGSVSEPVQPTSYGYDTLDNLITVVQGSQTRSFEYDSLKRLRTAQNPESGTINYQYDPNGNLTQKTDARNVTTTYAYDAINRNISVLYSDGTPSVYRYYDGSQRGIGRFTWQDTSGVSANVVDIYDEYGRPKQYRQRFWVNGAWSDNHFFVSANYNKAGQIVSQSYPSGRTVNYSYDTAGRLTNFTGNLGESETAPQRTYSTGASYSPFGGMTQEQFGMTTPIYHKRRYNIRGQLYDVRASTLSLTTGETDWNRGCLAAYYGGAAWGQSSTSNNGNVTMQQHFVPGVSGQSGGYWYMQDTYAYDALNRLTSVNEKHGNAESLSAPVFQQAYTYDRYGNRSIDANNTSPTVNNIQFDMTEAAGNNRIYAPGDTALPMNQRQMRYDAAGNLYHDTYTGQGTRTFDAENRMTKANNQTQFYTYDGDGKRVKRKVNGEEVWQVYGPGGELLAEYAANGAPSNPQKEYGYRNGELLISATSAVAGEEGGKINVASATASSVYESHVPANAIDGSVNTSWIAPAYAPQWIQLDLGSSRNLSKVRLNVMQDPAGQTTHQIYGGPDTNNLSLLGTLSGSTSNSQWLELLTSATSVRYVKVLTTSSPSWVGWSEIEVYAAGGTGGGTYRASTDFSSTQGQNNWYYVDENNSLMTYDTANNVWVGSEGPYQWLWNSGGHPGGAQDVVRQWRAPSAGSIRITGSASDGHTACGDGVVVTIKKGTQVLWQQTITNGNATGLSYDVTTSVASGDQINFVINRNGDPYCDSTTFDPTIAFSTGGGSPAKLNWLVTDHLGTPRMVLDETGSLANMSRHDYLPFGEEVPANFRTGVGGYGTGDNVRQKFTQKERDNETGLDYFGARYYGSAQGRFVSPDTFEKDSYLDNPQSWNKYVYVRNNPLFFIDPSGQKAEVVVTTDEKNKKRTVTIRASFAVYAAKGQKISEKQLQRQSNLIKSQIEKTYTGSTTKNGYTYEISTKVDVQVVADEKAAINSGADNIVEVGNKDLAYTSGGALGFANAAGYHGAGESFDRMIASTKSNPGAGNVYAHEFGHLLGYGGAHLGQGNVMSEWSPHGSALTNDDKGTLLGGFVSAHQFMGTASGQLSPNSKPIVQSLYKPFSTRTITQAPTMTKGWISWN